MRRTTDTLSSLAFFGGGTGGHVLPGVAVAERAQERFPGCRVLFFRTRRPVEEQIFSVWKFPTHTMHVDTPAGGAAAWLRYSYQSLRAIRKLRRFLRSGWDAVFGLGGYASLPGVIAARREAIPVVLLEQNLVPGRVNRLLAPFASAVSCPHPAVRSRLRGRTEVTGNPVRRQVLEAASLRRRWTGGPKQTVLVVGGSQGSRAINRAIQGALPSLLDFRPRVRWVHVTGANDREAVSSTYRQLGWEATVLEWSEELPKLMAQSDLVLGRAGGTTLAELAVVGVPAVLIPYPHHGDQHQRRNAAPFVESGGAWQVAEEQLGAQSLRRVFEEVLLSPERLQAMGAGVKRLGRPDAADRVIDLVLEVRRTCQRGFVSSS